MSKYLNDPKADTAGESCEQWPLSQVETTLKDLKEAFAGESQANRKYLAYAAAAEKEGLTGVAKLFKAAAAAETVHAHTHLRNMKGIGSTADNLKDAIAGETHEFKSMYPDMIEHAKARATRRPNAASPMPTRSRRCMRPVYEAARTRRPIRIRTGMSVRCAATLLPAVPRTSARSARPWPRPFSRLTRTAGS